jgi:type I restriction enzyme S subunit
VPEGWAWCRLKEICELKGGKRIPAGLSATKEKTNHIYIRVTDMQNNSISDADLVYITDDIFEKIQRYTINKDDLYLTIAGTIGRVGEVPEKFDGMNLTENALKLTNISICKTYLMHILNTKFVQDYFESTYHQVAMPKLSLINASKTIIPVPPLDEQQKIVKEIDTFFSITNNLEIDIVDLESLITRTKSKILDLAIHGKLVPQDPNDEPAEDLLKRIATSDNRPYEKVEASEIDWNLPNSWCLCHFGDIATVINGKNQSKVENPNGKYPIYGSGGIMGRADDFICPENCTIIGRKGSINNPIFVEEKFWNVDTAFGLCPSEAILPKLLFYFCEYFDFTTLDSSTTLPSLTKTNIQQIIFALPPIEEQKRILDRTEELFGKLDEIVLNMV